MARPINKLKTIEACVKNGCSMWETERYLGLQEGEVGRFLMSNKDINNKLIRCSMYHICNAKKTINSCISKGDGRLALDYLIYLHDSQKDNVDHKQDKTSLRDNIGGLFLLIIFIILSGVIGYLLA